MASWADFAKKELAEGRSLVIRPKGNSMVGLVESGQEVLVEPIVDPSLLKVGDVVLCRVRGTDYLDLIKAVGDERWLIGNNRGRINGWVRAGSLFGLAKLYPQAVGLMHTILQA